MTQTMREFSCKQCGGCCRWSGYVYLRDADICVFAEALKMSEEAFIDQFTRLNPNRGGLCLIEQDDGACVFLKDGRCEHYEARPEQCRNYPGKWAVPEGCPGFE